MEWGYYVKTIKNKDNSLLSQVLIFDIAQLKATDTTTDIITIKVVEHSNYKYSETDDSVFYYGQNNLCIGNPTSSGDFTLTVSDLQWRPKFNPEKATAEQKMEIRANSSILKSYYYYVSFDFNCTFTIYNPYYSEVRYVYIYDASFNEIKNTRMWDDTMLTIEAKSNEVFIIGLEIYSPLSSSYIMELTITK